MGLTIQYSLRSTTRYNDDARQLVEKLRQRALDLPFRFVGDLLDLKGPECDYEKHEQTYRYRWLLIQANQPIELEGFGYSVTPTRMFAFATSPGEGSEPANFGLCRYPRFVKDRNGRRVSTGLPSGWFWQSFCKTQFASNPATGDIENFVKCHLAVISVLDAAKDLNILHHITDEGGYWTQRDVKALVEEVAEWNAMLAGLVGSMKDQIGGKDIQSEITKFSNYEHLEAKGRADEDDSDKP